MEAYTFRPNFYNFGDTISLDTLGNWKIVFDEASEEIKCAENDKHRESYDEDEDISETSVEEFKNLYNTTSNKDVDQ